MADGEEHTQNTQEGNQEAQKPDTSKIYSNGYNNGLETAEKRVLKRFGELTGQEYSSIDDIYDWTKTSSSKLAESISDPTQTEEYKSLQGKLKEYESQLKEAQGKAEAIQNKYKFDSTWNSAESEFLSDSEYLIPKEDVKAIWDTRFKVEYKDGKEIVKQGDVPVMNDAGEYKPVQAVIKDFTKSYIKTTAQGTGGGSGDGSGAKIKRSDFNKAVNAGDNEKAQELFNQGEQNGWIEE